MTILAGWKKIQTEFQSDRQRFSITIKLSRSASPGAQGSKNTYSVKRSTVILSMVF